MDYLSNYLESNKDNLVVEEIMKKFNLSVSTVYRHLRMRGLKPKKERDEKRLIEINKMRSEGKTYREIGKAYNISRQRVEQLINGHN